MKKITLAKPLLLLFLGSLFLLSCSPAPQSTPVAEPVVITESAASAAASQPDLSGIWQAVNTAHWNVEGHTAKKMPVTGVIGAYGGMLAGTSVVVGGEIPYRADALAAREVNQADWANLDPAAKCYMPGIPRQTYMPAPFQILQTDSEIFIAYEWGSNSRSIFMDRPGTSAPLPSWMGYSLGRWEGGTLIVDVTSQMTDTWFDAAGNYHSGSLHVEERYRMIDENHIEYQALITDPEVFTEPWTIRMPLYRRIEEDARLLEYKCIEYAEDLLYDHLRQGYDGSTALDGSEPDDNA
ncbi:hypothetical protein OAE08_03170 [Gammaproteobacteria bacterium]|nr:hypothetical protein [Gammaproteobacteria bacterium]